MLDRYTTGACRTREQAQTPCTRVPKRASPSHSGRTPAVLPALFISRARRRAMTTIQVFSRPKLRNPLLVEGLPGVGNIGRMTVGYLIKELGAVKFADLYSEHFFPFV